jgi:hypothetical protein
MVDMTKKQCICCGVEKPLEAFSIHRRMRDGRLNKCKACCVEYARQHRASRPTEELRAMRHAEYEACIHSGSRTRERSLDEVRAQHDPVNRKINALRYVHKNRVKSCQPTELDDLVFSEAVRISRSRTRVTGVPWEIDHIVPIKAKFASGLHNAFNIQVVPKRWNELKSNKNADLFFPRREIGY